MNNVIIDKIQKLLRLSESSNEHEAKLAMLKAQELLAKHKLSLKEVKEYKTYNSKIKKKVSEVRFRTGKWKARLGHLIADNFGCYIYFLTNRTHSIVFFGREEDIIVCNIVLEYAVDCIESSVKRIQRRYRREEKSTKGLSNDYALGFIEGLDEQFEKQKEENREWGLVLVKDKEVTDAYNEINFSRTINTSTKYKGNKEVYLKGVDDGLKFSISDKIAERDGEEVLEISNM